MKKNLFYFIIIIFNSVYAQQGAIDPSFNPLDINVANAGPNGIVRTFALQPDGKIIVAGDFTSFRGTTRNKIARVNSDGTLDTSFDPAAGANDIIKTVVLQSDGKIIIGGFFTSFNGVSRSRLARLNANGTLDTSFNPGLGSNGTINSTVLQPDGKIIIAGNFTMFAGTSRNYIARVSSNGTLDPTFDPGAGANSTINTIALQSDGKIVLGGSFTSYAGTPRPYLARANANGTLDDLFYVFNPGVGFNNAVNSVALQADGKVIIGGDFTTYSGINRGRIARLMGDGNLDASFNSGTGANGTVNSAVVQPDGKIIIGGSFTTYGGNARNSVALLNTNGIADSFTSNSATVGTTHALLYQPDGKIILGGDFTELGYKLMRLNADGSHNTLFVGIGGVGQLNIYQPQPGIVRKALLAPDGKIIIGGCFMSYNGILRNDVARLNSDGTLDQSFNLGAGIFNPCVEPLAIQSDGKVIIDNARLNSDGTVDATYNSGSVGANSIINTVYVQPDGKMLIGGRFYQYNGVNRGGVARLNANGTLDATFTTTTGATYWQPGYTQDVQGIVYSVVRLSSGKILIGGFFTKYNGTAKSSIARLNSNGTLDNTFNVVLTPTADVVHVIKEQPDGKILIGGQFTTVNGVARNSIARLNSDGTLDTSFTPPGTGYNLSSENILLQPDGKMVLQGSFTLNGVTTKAPIRLNTNGTHDASFNTGTGVNYNVISSILLPDAKIIIAGNFTSYNGTSKNGIARILNRFDQVITFGSLANQCIGSNVTLTATSTSGLPITYTSSNSSIATISGNTITTHAVGTVTITASQLGNGTYNPAGSVVRSLTVGNTASLTSIITPSGDLPYCNGTSISENLQASASPNQNLSYQWRRNGINIPGATSPNYLATQDGVYVAVITSVVNGCTRSGKSAPANIYYISCGGGGECPDPYNPNCPCYEGPCARMRPPATKVDEPLEFGIFPNPADDELVIQLDKIAEMDNDVLLYSQTGAVASRNTLIKGESKLTVDTKPLPSGLYYIVINGYGVRKKVMVVH